MTITFTHFLRHLTQAAAAAANMVEVEFQNLPS
jgi:hypothetical protein